jgi:hypothetical protein
MKAEGATIPVLCKIAKVESHLNPGPANVGNRRASKANEKNSHVSSLLKTDSIMKTKVKQPTASQTNSRQNRHSTPAKLEMHTYLVFIQKFEFDIKNLAQLFKFFSMLLIRLLQLRRLARTAVRLNI